MKMQTSNDILNELSRRNGGCSDYAICKMLSVGTGVLSAIRNGRRSLSRNQCKQIAQLLDVEVGALITVTEAERESDPEMKASLQRMAQRAFAAATVAMIIGNASIAYPPPAQAAQDAMCIMLNRKRRRTDRGPGRRRPHPLIANNRQRQRHSE